MNVKQLINILSEMSPDADVGLFIDIREDGVVTTELFELSLDDVVIGASYVGFQVPPEFTGGFDNE
jgi:hypothetical protein